VSPPPHDSCLQGQAGARPGLVPEGVHAGLHYRVQVARGQRRERGFAKRWTFYIDKGGKIAAIDKTVKPATSAEDMIAKLGELKVEAKR
jgi:peroxiredoxin